MNGILTCKNHNLFIFQVFLVLFLMAGVCGFGVAQAAIVYTGATSGANNGLPTDTTAGPLTIVKPAGTVAGQALITSIAARPSGMVVTVPAGWFAMTVTQQPAGGVSTLPGGMTLLTYYHIVGTADPASYTWTFANTAGSGPNYGGSAVGGILAFSGIDTSGGNPINVWSARLTASGLTHSTNAITPTMANTMIVSSISYLSGDSFANPTGIAGITERLDQRAPAAINAIGTTIQMSTAPWATATVVGPSQAVAASNADTGVGHLMALKPAAIDPAITMARSGPLAPGGSAFYTMSVTNNGISSEPGPISVVDTLPAGLTYNATGSGGTGWVCSAVGQVVTCTRAGALAGGASAAPLVLNVNVSAGASGTLTNTATVSGTGGDSNMANNTATDSYTIAKDLNLAMTHVGVMDPGQNASYVLDVTNIGTAAESGPITVTDTLPAGLTYVSGAGTGWVCSAVGQAVTCTRAGSLAAGAAAATLTLTVAVSPTTFAISNTATVAGNGADGTPANNTATDTYNMTADLSLTKTRGAALVPGTNATYTLNVTNAGPNVAPQPITITDTLPAGLTFVSGVGTGWSCSAAGQVVTCTRTGTLASGASSSLVLTVAVSAGATGAITNTATVTGTAIDSTPANNTATDSYTIVLSTYAYYKMDEASWTGVAGEVLDSSGNNRNASRIGGATVTTEAAPASGLKGDTCRAATIPLGTGAATQMGVNTPINPNALGTAGTVSFWYKNNVAWTANGNTNDRTLLDATGATNAGEFWLVLQQTGVLQFSLDNAGGTVQTAPGTAKGFAVNTWHHIAITWNFTAHTMFIYVDGVQDATRSNNAVTSATTNYGTFFAGDSKTTVYTNPNRGNSANGVIDEVRLYASALTAAQITTDMNATHACGVGALDHIRIEHDGSAISCSAEVVVVKACANASCSTLYTGGVTGNLTAGGNSVPFTIPSGQSQTTVNIHLPSDSAQVDPQTVRLGTSSVSPVPTYAGSPYCSKNAGVPDTTTACDMSVYKAGFLFDVPNLVSGTASGPVNISAVRSSDSSTCVPLFQNVTRTVAFWGNYQNPVSGTLPLKVNGLDIETTATPAYTSTFSLAFNSSGVATLTSVRYDDVGLMQLNARYVGSSANTPPDAGMIVTGTDPFVVKPDHFELTAIQQTAAPNLVNPAAANASGDKFVRASEQFSVIVTAKNALGNTTPNYGNETIPESVKLTSAVVTGLGLTHDLTTVGGSFGDFGVDCAGYAGTAGSACGTEFTWDEVGIITLTPSIEEGDYLGAGNVTGTVSGNVGRFTPDHFLVSPGTIVNRRLASCTSSSSFTYAGEELQVSNFHITAYNGLTTPTITANYAGLFAKFDGSVVANFNFGAIDLADALPPISATAFTVGSNPGEVTIVSSSPVPSSGNGWAAGVGTFNANLKLNRAAAPSGPYASFHLGIVPSDTDAVTVLSADMNLDTSVPPGTPDRVDVGNTIIRYGLLKIFNNFGPETADITNSPFEVRYYDGTKWVVHVDDNCTTGLTFDTARITAIRPVPLAAGKGTFTVTTSAVAESLTACLVTPAWLTALTNCITPECSSCGGFTFGIYRGNDRIINWQEIMR